MGRNMMDCFDTVSPGELMDKSKASDGRYSKK